MLTDAVGVRSSKGGILRAGASKLCVDKERVGMMRGVGMKCRTTNPILPGVDMCNFYEELKMNGRQ